MQKWTRPEDDQVSKMRENGVTAGKLAEILDRTPAAITARAYVLRHKKPNGNGEPVVEETKAKGKAKPKVKVKKAKRKVRKQSYQQANGDRFERLQDVIDLVADGTLAKVDVPAGSPLLFRLSV